jgi:hypothetical protein
MKKEVKILRGKAIDSLAEIVRAAPSVLERHFGNHSDPVLVSAPEMASLEAKIA